MSDAHDVGGAKDGGAIDRSGHELSDWEVLADGLSQALDAKGIWNTDAHRRVREQMTEEQYDELSYYERWIYAVENALLELDVLTKPEIDDKVRDLERTWGNAAT